MPAYNRANLVGKAIDSVLTQEVDADIELLIGDNASTEDTKSVYEEYMRKYPGKITVFYRKENLGIGANWAALMMACKGKYIANCDNDDYWHNPHKLQLQLDYMESHPEANVLFTDFQILYGKTGKIEEKHLYPYYKTKEELQNAIWRGEGENMYHTNTMFLRTEFIHANIPLQDFIDRRMPVQDWPFYLLLLDKTNFDILQVSTATIFVQGESYTHQKSYQNFEARLRRDAENMKYVCEKLPYLGKFDETEWDAYINTMLLAFAYRNNDYRKANYYARLTSYPSRKKSLAKTWLTFKLCVWASKLKRILRRVE